MGSFEKKERNLLYTFLAFAVLYILIIPINKVIPGLYVLKDIPDVILAVLALTAVADLRGQLLFITYILCAMAGLALDLPVQNAFLIGLALFLLAHVGYIVVFSRDFKWQRKRVWLIVLLVLYAAGMAVIMLPFLGGMLFPVYAYMAILITMVVMAALRQPSSRSVLCGALLFLVSDSALAVNKFLIPLPYADYIVTITYYGAQFLILFGFLREKYRQSA
ncbi:MAG: lysoplasmalogenase [Dehalococcoidia bacterium]|nr:lysoplasmalogenase [Dehalococcoidia bacterium]MDD5494323.1 lysoplasmalogenase [Dehalococcoidia bacterium]